MILIMTCLHSKCVEILIHCLLFMCKNHLSRVGNVLITLLQSDIHAFLPRNEKKVNVWSCSVSHASVIMQRNVCKSFVLLSFAFAG